jgi:ABC-type nitrate/sulfonate/bicarbonate transport system substrate-binding protein
MEEAAMPTRRTLIKQIGAITVLPAVAATIGRGPAIAQGMKTVRLADQNGSEIDYAAVWVAELNGYFEQEGIKIDRKTYPNGPSALLDINNLDAVMAAIVPFMQYVARGGDVRIVMSVTKGNAPIVGKKRTSTARKSARRGSGRFMMRCLAISSKRWDSNLSTCPARSPTSPS